MCTLLVRVDPILELVGARAALYFYIFFFNIVYLYYIQRIKEIYFFGVVFPSIKNTLKQTYPKFRKISMVKFET